MAPDMALGLMKKLVNRSVLADINETLELEGFAQAMCFESNQISKKALMHFLKNVNPI